VFANGREHKDVEVEKSSGVDYFKQPMKASPLPSTLHALLLCAGLLSVVCAPALAQDAVVLKSGQTREGKIVGVSGGNVRIETSAGTVGTPLSQVREIRMAPPEAFEAAAAMLASGDAGGAVSALTQLNETFSGLPAPWAERAAAMLGDAKLATGDTEGAKAAYEQFRQTYPQATTLANLGMARLAVDAGQYNEAEKLLQPVLQASDKTAFPDSAEGPALSQGHYLLGRVKEAAGDHQAALANYLKASTVFPFDSNAAASAQKQADALRAEHAGLIAP
jgi:tetratricopeptide (TPR) repeat protein